MSLIEDGLSAVTGLTPIQKKLIVGAIIGLGGFWGGIKFSDVRLKAEIGGYQIEINKLKQTVATRDVDIQGHLTVKEQKMKEASIAKEEADKAHAQAADAEARYRKLVAQAEGQSKSSSDLTPLPERAIGVIEVTKACDEVIAKKDEEIKGLNAAYSNVFDAKAAADLAIKDLQANEVDLKKEVSLNEKINNDLRKQLESQNRRKWLYLAGGVILGVAGKKALDHKP